VSQVITGLLGWLLATSAYQSSAVVHLQGISEAEQVAGFFACLEDELELPFTTRLFGVDVSVEQIEQTEHDDIVAVCRRDNDTAAIRLVDLPLPTSLPEGAQWIAAWKKWQTGS
jgi:hypothetical protein